MDQQNNYRWQHPLPNESFVKIHSSTNVSEAGAEAMSVTKGGEIHATVELSI